MNQKRNYFDFVNITKLILAVSIAAMHCGLVPEHSWLMTFVCRLGVPYFFVASGFFFEKKLHRGTPKHAVKLYVKRLLLPYSIFSVVWILQMLIDNALGHVGVWESVLRVAQSILFYPRGALWYVWASIIGVLMLYPFLKRKKLHLALPFGLALFAVGLLANHYYFVAAKSPWLKTVVDAYLKICLVSNNGPFVGFVFLLIGMLISERYDWIAAHGKLPASLLVLVLSSALLLFEDSFLQSQANTIGDGAFYLSQLIYVPAVFYLTTRIPCPHLRNAVSTTAKNLSTGIYFLHVPLLWIIHRSAAYLLPRIPGLGKLSPLFDHAAVCFPCCLFLCLAICLLAYRHPKSFLCKILK